MASICKIPNAEIEDLYPPMFIANIFTRYLRNSENYFSDEVKIGEAIVPQMEAFARNNQQPLNPGWKVEIAKLAKARLLRDDNSINDQDVFAMWQELFNYLEV